jgi:hypothetical protein
MSDPENFLSRWSRRKLKARADATDTEVRAQPEAAAGPVVEAAAESGSPEPAAPENSPAPEYRQYFDPEVDEKLRRAALTKLFSDPHFNVMDGLDTYVDDYSKPDPIPAAMLRQLNQAKNLFLFDEEKEAGTAAEAPAAGPAAADAPAHSHAAAAGAADPVAATAQPADEGKNA